MLWEIYSFLTQPGNGFMFNKLYLDIFLLGFVPYITWAVIIPILRLYQQSKTLDGLCGTDQKHWFYGHVRKYGFYHDNLIARLKRTLIFPKLFNMWIGPFLSEVQCSHHDTTSSILKSGAPKNSMGYEYIRPWIGDGLLTSKGRKWQRNRRLLTPAFHYSILKPYLKVFNKCARTMLDNFENSIGAAVEVSGPISRMTLDSMMQCALSAETGCQNTEGKHPYIEAVYELSTVILLRFYKPIYLLDWIFHFSDEWKRFKKAADVVHSYAENLIHERRKFLKEQEKEQVESHLGFKARGEKNLDFLDILLQTKDEDGRGLTDQEIRDEVDTFLFEGHDTTASALSWAFYNLAKYPEYQEKCREEITSVLSDKEDVEWEDLSKLSYLTMFIKESMRLRTPVPAIGRYLEHPLKLAEGKEGETTIPSGTNVAVLIFSQHMNEHIWENPFVFDPDRFTADNIAKRSPHAFIPFSAGSRNCIGQNFAMNEIKVTLAQTIRRYSLSLDEDIPEPRMVASLVLRSENGILVKIKLVKNE